MTEIVTARFHGTELYAFRFADIIYVALKPIADAMGLDWSTQCRKAKRDPILSEGIAVLAIPFNPAGTQKAVCLRLDLLNGWLFQINSARVPAEIRERVQLYQRECYRVLNSFFLGDHERQQANEKESLDLRLVTECRHLWGVKAGMQLWKERGLPIVPAMIEMPVQNDLFGYGEGEMNFIGERST